MFLRLNPTRTSRTLPLVPVTGVPSVAWHGSSASRPARLPSLLFFLSLVQPLWDQNSLIALFFLLLYGGLVAAPSARISPGSLGT